MEHILDIALEEQAKEIFKSVESYMPYNLNKITGWKQVKQKYGVEK